MDTEDFQGAKLTGGPPSNEVAKRFISRAEAVGKRLLSRDEIEAEYGITRRWLELAAHRGDGPPMRKISRRMVKYDRAEFEAWLETMRVNDPTGAA